MGIPGNLIFLSRKKIATEKHFSFSYIISVLRIDDYFLLLKYTTREEVSKCQFINTETVCFRIHKNIYKSLCLHMRRITKHCDTKTSQFVIWYIEMCNIGHTTK